MVDSFDAARYSAADVQHSDPDATAAFPCIIVSAVAEFGKRFGCIMKKAIKNPYVLTSLLFLVLVIYSGYVLGWREEKLGFLLLLYFVITIGIRLDDISSQIGADHDRPTQIADEDPSLSDHLRDIKTTLISIDATLKAMQGEMRGGFSYGEKEREREQEKEQEHEHEREQDEG